MINNVINLDNESGALDKIGVYFNTGDTAWQAVCHLVSVKKPFSNLYICQGLVWGTGYET